MEGLAQQKGRHDRGEAGDLHQRTELRNPGPGLSGSARRSQITDRCRVTQTAVLGRYSTLCMYVGVPLWIQAQNRAAAAGLHVRSLCTSRSQSHWRA